MNGNLGLGLGIGLSGGGAAAAPSLSVVITPSSLTWQDQGDFYQTGNFTATVSDGTGSVTFLWELLTGDGGNYLLEGSAGQTNTPNVVNLNSVANDATYPASPGAASLRCTATDDNSSAVSNTVTIS